MNWTGELWPEWQIENVIGTGAYGTVYKIKREDIGGTYYAALKVISYPGDTRETEALHKKMSDKKIAALYNKKAQEICREIALMEHLKGNTNIVSYEDHKIVPHRKDPGWDILIRMELLTSLQDYLEEHPVNEADVCSFGMDICTALSLCEKEKILHRDIKPGNIFVSDFGDFKLGDFGLARHLAFADYGQSPQGTLLYMAPEVFSEQRYDKTIDTYALGLIIFRLLNRGREPFLPLPPEPVTGKMYEKANRRRLEAERLPRPVDASDEMMRLLLRACAHNPSRRFRNAEEMRTALQKCRDSGMSGKSIRRNVSLARKTPGRGVYSSGEGLGSEMSSTLRMPEPYGDDSIDYTVALSGSFRADKTTADTMGEFFMVPGDL